MASFFSGAKHRTRSGTLSWTRRSRVTLSSALRLSSDAISASNSPSRPLNSTERIARRAPHHVAQVMQRALVRRDDGTGGERRARHQRRSRIMRALAFQRRRNLDIARPASTTLSPSLPFATNMSSAPNIQSDIQAGDWIDRHVPAGWRPMRGWRGSTGRSASGCCCCPAGGRSRWRPARRLARSSGLMVLFAIGALVMRGAGCTVQRHRRPRHRRQGRAHRAAAAASRPVSRARRPASFLGLQLAARPVILLQLRRYGDLARRRLAGRWSRVYPFMKRITWWPQALLGLTFNWGALMGWAAVAGRARRGRRCCSMPAGFFWTSATTPSTPTRTRRTTR